MLLSRFLKIFLAFLVLLPLSLLSSHRMSYDEQMSHEVNILNSRVRYSVDPDYTLLEPLVGVWQTSNLYEAGSVNDQLTMVEIYYEDFYNKFIAKGFDQNSFLYECFIDEGIYTTSYHTYICWNYESTDGLNDTFYNFSFEGENLQGMHFIGEFSAALDAFSTGQGDIIIARPQNGISSSSPSSSTSSSSSSNISQEDILNSNLITLKNRLLSIKNYNVSGSFASYDFPGVDAAFDWTFVTQDGTVYQLQGNAPSANDVFGWKKVHVNPDEPAWYMANLGDWDGDGTGKYDWILVGNGFDAVYKLEGVTASGNFAYSESIDIPYSISSDKKIITFGESSDSSSSSEGLLPGEVLEQAMEAQMNGDIDGFMSKCAFEGVSEEDVKQTREILEMVDDNIIFSNFKLEPLATGIYKEGTVAVVRAITSYIINGEYQEKNGVLVYLKKELDKWKLVRILPDTLLNQEIYEESVEFNITSKLYLRKNMRAPSTLKEFNKKLNNLLKTTHIDEGQAIWDSSFTVIGQLGKVPGGIGRGFKIVSLSENIVDLGSDFIELSVLYGYGDTSNIKTAKWAEISAGAMQLALELRPPGYGDTLSQIYADGAAAACKQVTYNLKIRQYIKLLQHILMDPKLPHLNNPYIYHYGIYPVETGINIYSNSNLAMPNQYPYVTGIDITTSSALGMDLIFKVLSSIEFPDRYKPINEALIELGGVIGEDGNIDLALDITSRAKEVLFSGDGLIEFNKMNLGSGNFGSVTCRRGEQSFEVKMINGSTTSKVHIETFMNDIDRLSITETYQDGIELHVGESVSGIQIFGVGPNIKVDLTPTYFIDTPNLCLDMKIYNTTIASLKRDSMISIDGVNSGKTSLNITLEGSIGSISEIKIFYPIIVCTENETNENGECVNESPIYYSPSQDACENGGGVFYDGGDEFFDECMVTWHNAISICEMPSKEMWEAVIIGCGGIVGDATANATNSAYKKCYEDLGYSFGYWTSATWISPFDYDGTDFAEFVHLANGTSHGNAEKTDKRYMRCVSGGR